MKNWKTLVLLPSMLLAMTSGCATTKPTGATAKADEPTPQQREARRKRMREMMSKDDGAPKVGDVAPTFTLKALNGSGTTDLASYRGSKPVVLFFGSYT